MAARRRSAIASADRPVTGDVDSDTLHSRTPDLTVVTVVPVGVAGFGG